MERDVLICNQASLFGVFITCIAANQRHFKGMVQHWYLVNR